MIFVQHKFYDLLHTAIDGKLLYELGIFDLGKQKVNFFNSIWTNMWTGTHQNIVYNSKQLKDFNEVGIKNILKIRAAL